MCGLRVTVCAMPWRPRSHKLFSHERMNRSAHKMHPGGHHWACPVLHCNVEALTCKPINTRVPVFPFSASWSFAKFRFFLLSYQAASNLLLVNKFLPCYVTCKNRFFSQFVDENYFFQQNVIAEYGECWSAPLTPCSWLGCEYSASLTSSFIKTASRR